MYKETSQNSCVSGVDHRGDCYCLSALLPPIQYGAQLCGVEWDILLRLTYYPVNLLAAPSAGPPDDPGSQGPVQRDSAPLARTARYPLPRWQNCWACRWRRLTPSGTRWSPSDGSRRRKKSFSVLWQRCSRDWAVPRTDIRKIPADRQFQRLNCLFLFYKNPLYFQSGYAILGM